MSTKILGECVRRDHFNDLNAVQEHFKVNIDPHADLSIEQWIQKLTLLSEEVGKDATLIFDAGYETISIQTCTMKSNFGK